jgi:hypothetical protein
MQATLSVKEMAGLRIFPRSSANRVKAWSGGNQEALTELMPKVYLELRRMARAWLLTELAQGAS